IEDDARRIAQHPRDRLREWGMALPDRERDRHRVRLLTRRDLEPEARAVHRCPSRAERRVPVGPPRIGRDPELEARLDPAGAGDGHGPGALAAQPDPLGARLYLDPWRATEA